MELTQNRKDILQLLENNKISYEYHEHERLFTIDDCLQKSFITDDVTICKNIFLSNRQHTKFYLLLLKPKTIFHTSVVSKALQVSRLSFAPHEILEERLRLTSGSVSPLALFYDKEHEITLCYEKSICDTEKIAFHPCDNAATIIFTQEIFWNKVLPILGVSPVRLDLSLEND